MKRACLRFNTSTNNQNASSLPDYAMQAGIRPLKINFTPMKKFLLPILLILSAHTCEKIKPDNPEITENELKVHERVLASDELAGRYPGTAGDSLAVAYIREHFRAYKLELPFEEGIQHFPVVTSVKPGPLNMLAKGKWAGKNGVDFGPYAFSSTLPLKAQGVFVWYGLQFKNDT